MRPYLAIIFDSFHEAMASRVLWLLLILITVFLLVLAPLSYREEITTTLRESDIRGQQFPRLVEIIRTQGTQEEPSPARVVWLHLDESLQQKLKDFSMPKEGDVQGAFALPRTMEQLRTGLNQMLEKEDLYDKRAWRGVELLSDEARQLVREDRQLSTKEVARRNRLLLEAAFPDIIQVSARTSIRLRYLIWNFGPPVPLRGEQFAERLETFVAWVMQWIVGAIGVFVAILVTASIIPQTFDPGSLNLLLSKPISRWLLFLAKFIGGCAFIFINAAYLIGGLLLILGIRFGVWQPKLLLCIPIYLFVFAIYYSVSAWAGIYWRSAIICIVVTILFWLACFLVGFSKGQIEQQYLDKLRIARIVPTQASPICVNEVGISGQWDAPSRKWQDIFVSQEQKQMGPMLYVLPLQALPKPIGPVLDQQNEQLVAIHRGIGPRRFGQLSLYAGRRDEDWQCAGGTNAPVGTFELLREPQGTILAVSSMGLYRLVGDPQADADPMKILGVAVPLTGSGPFRSVGPKNLILTQPAAAAIDPEEGRVALYTRGKLTVLEQDEQGKYVKKIEQKLDLQQGQAVVMALSGRTLLIARDDGAVSVHDADTLQQRKEFQPEGSNQPRFVRGAPGGRWFALLFHNRRLWLLDADSDRFQAAQLPGQGGISAIEFTGPAALQVADRTNRVSQYHLPDTKLQERWSPKMDVLQRCYRYAILPLYTIFPKPGELDNTIQYVLTGKETQSNRENRDNLSAAQTNLDPWTPLWSSLLFMLVVLVISCVYIERQEF